MLFSLGFGEPLAFLLEFLYLVFLLLLPALVLLLLLAFLFLPEALGLLLVSADALFLQSDAFLLFLLLLELLLREFGDGRSVARRPLLALLDLGSRFLFFLVFFVSGWGFGRFFFLGFGLGLLLLSFREGLLLFGLLSAVF